MPHYPGHLRDAFCGWLEEGCPPLARVEVNYQETTWTGEQLCKRMLACADTMPGGIYRETVERYGLTQSRKQTYGSVARALLEQMQETATA